MVPPNGQLGQGNLTAVPHCLTSQIEPLPNFYLKQHAVQRAIWHGGDENW
jgi:hypothetical protein